jgi:hypothetical protein
MKKLLVITVAALSLVAMQARASVGLTLGVLDILDENGNLAPVNTVGLWVVDTTGAGFALPTSISSGSSIAVGQYFNGGNLQIVDVEDILTTTAQPGYDSLTFNGTYGVGNIAATGEKFGIIWLPEQTIENTTLAAGYAGIFSDGVGTYSAAWVLPADGANLGYDMTTVSELGGVPDADGLASIMIVPEPSSLALVVVGLLGAVGMIRRRR